MISPFYFAVTASVTLLICGFLSQFIKISRNGLSILQHFAAGIIFSAVAVELIPKLLESELKWDIAIGFLLGLFCMLLFRLIGERESSPAALITGYGVDLWIDGILIALAYLASERSGLIITGALCLEVAFLAFALMPTLRYRGASSIVQLITVSILAALIPMGTVMGYAVIHHLPEGYYEATLAFGVAALLFLVTEELLYEAHEKPDSIIGTAAFFVGFLIILLF